MLEGRSQTAPPGLIHEKNSLKDHLGRVRKVHQLECHITIVQ